VKKILLFLLLISIFSISKTIKPRIIKAGDRRYRGGDPIGISTIEASSQATSVGLFASTSANMENQNYYSKEELFLQQNREHIVKDIAKGQGEYLSTLFELLKIKPTKEAVQKLQQNITTLSELEDREFLDKCIVLAKK